MREGTTLESHFSFFRDRIIGNDKTISNHKGEQVPMIYADWTASGRCYGPIESRLTKEIMPLVANTHTETSTSGMAMTHAYHQARQIIKRHVNANDEDVIITSGSGMTGMVNKFQRILGLRNQHKGELNEARDADPVVFISHMEHHSNHTSWLETTVTLEIINPTDDGLIDLDHLSKLLKKYEDRPIKIASVTACSNVTGIITPYYEIAKLMHGNGGLCFVDFACSAPYVDIDMHPSENGAQLDAVLFSPHKFLGGPGSSGVLVFNKKLYDQKVPDNPGGGTVEYTNPWGEHLYTSDIESREDGGTPAFLQTIKAAMSVRLKEEMGVENMMRREKDLMELFWDELGEIPNLHLLAEQHKKRVCVISFYIDELHYNLGVRILNDRFGIQSRGGCSCAGTYGHYLLNVDRSKSEEIRDKINLLDYSDKPGWIRVSLHPTMTNEEVKFLAASIKDLAKNHEEWGRSYSFDASCNKLSSRDVDLDADVRKQINDAFFASYKDSATKVV